MNKKPNIKLNITKSDARNAGDYCDNRNCLAATAAKRQFNVDYVSCGPSGLTIGGTYYVISATAAIKLRRSYPPHQCPAKVKPGFRPFTIILRPL